MDTPVTTEPKVSINIQEMLAAWVEGFDTSHWEPINWDTLVALSHMLFTIFKATEGTTFKDSTFDFNKANCQRLGFPWGSFHFYHPGDPIAQARYYDSVVGDGCDVYVCDVETLLVNAALEALKKQNAKIRIGSLAIGKPEYATFRLSGDTALDADTYGVTSREILQFRNLLAAEYLKAMGSASLTLAQQVSTFLHEIKRLRPNAKLVVYTSPYFCNTYLKPTADFTEFYLWIAHVTSASQPIVPKPWNSWTLWQWTFSLKVPGATGYVDGDRWYDTVSAMHAFFGNVTPPPVTAYNHLEALTLVAGQNVRSGPGIGYPVVGTLPAGVIVNVGNVYAPAECWAKLYDENHNLIGWAAIKYAGKQYLTVQE